MNGDTRSNNNNNNNNNAAVLPWLRVPVRVATGSGVALALVRGLPPLLRSALEAQPRAFRELLPVQAAAWAQLGGGLSDAHDLCLAAPTGSGKTLAYALPVVNGLLQQRGAGAALRAAAGAAAPPTDNNNNDDRPLRALIVVPTRDLAAQVHALVADLCAAVGLRAALAAAQRPATEEAAACLGRRAQAAAPLLPPMAAAAESCGDGPVNAAAAGNNDLALRGGGGRADVLVATPGRLAALLPGGGGRWPGLCLARLRFLVVDEADRLLRQAYQDWLPRVLEAAEAAGAAGDAAAAAAAAAPPDPLPPPLLPCSAAPPFGPGARLVKMIVSATLTRDPSKLARFALWQPRYVALVAAGDEGEEEGQEEAVAAAAAPEAAAAAVAQADEEQRVGDEYEDDDEDEDDDGQDDDEAEDGAAAKPPPKRPAPAPAAARPPPTADPLQARFQLPLTLEQRRLVAQAHRKPLALASLLRELGPQQRTLVFCSSVDTTRRLYLLLSALLGRGALPCGVAELGGHMSAARRAEAVEALRTGRAGVLVSSDAMARGMDVAGGGGAAGGGAGGGSGGDGPVAGVQTVVCYDFPPSARAYVHRAGRTARAGAKGTVISLLRPQEVVHFRRMLKGKVGGGGGAGKVREWRLAREHREAVAPALRGAMLQVRELLESEGVMGAAAAGVAAGGGGGGGEAEEDEDGEEAAAGSAGGSDDDDDEEEDAPAAAAAASNAQPQTRAKKKHRTD